MRFRFLLYLYYIIFFCKEKARVATLCQRGLILIPHFYSELPVFLSHRKYIAVFIVRGEIDNIRPRTISPKIYDGNTHSRLRRIRSTPDPETIGPYSCRRNYSLLQPPINQQRQIEICIIDDGDLGNIQRKVSRNVHETRASRQPKHSEHQDKNPFHSSSLILCARRFIFIFSHKQRQDLSSLRSRVLLRKNLEICPEQIA